MRKIELTILLLMAGCLLQPLLAQEPHSRLTAPGDTYFRIEHEVQIGIGDVYMTNTLYRYNGVFSTPQSSSTDIFGADIYYGAEHSSGALSLLYTCRTKKWLWFGGSLTYAGFYRSAYDRITDNFAYRYNSHFLSLMPTVRFSYVNRTHVTLYSGLAVGGALAVAACTDNNGTERTVSGKFVFQATAFGIAAGWHNFYAFAELGVGVRGYFYGGFGYRFHSLENKNALKVNCEK